MVINSPLRVEKKFVIYTKNLFLKGVHNVFHADDNINIVTDRSTFAWRMHDLR